MSRIQPHIVEKIYNALDIVEVVSDYVSLKKRGANYWGLSPFVNEKTPSFAVNPVKGIYKDFSSGKGGNGVNFLMEVEGYSYAEALRHIARKYSIEIEEVEESQEQKQQRDKRESLLIVNEFAARFFQQQLLENEKGREIGLSYFKERGLLDSSIEEFMLGYSPDEWEALVHAAAEQKYNDEYLLELGLASRSEKTGRLVDRFRDRVMFPIHNALGKIVGFGGRILGNRKDTGKYINSPESELYHKSEVLYGLFQARKAIRDKDLCILTEGYLDVILLHQNDIKNAVASSGTALTIEQIRLIRRFTQHVLLIYDGDPAGIKAALRGIDLLVKEGIDTRVLILPDNHDPDSYLRAHGRAAFLECIEKEALSFLDFKIRVLGEGKKTSDPQAQAELLRAVAETLAGMNDRIQREMYVKYAAQQLSVQEGLMALAVTEAQQELRKLENQAARRDATREARIDRGSAPEGDPSQEEFPVSPTKEAPVREMRSFEQLELVKQEEEILRVMVCHYDKELPGDAEGEKVWLMDYFYVELEGLTFENQVYERLKKDLFAEFEAHQTLRLQQYLNHEDMAICRLVANLLTTPDTSPLWKKIRPDLDYDGDLKRVFEGAVFHYKNRKVEQLLTECRLKLKDAQAQGDEALADQLLQSHLQLTNLRKSIHQKLSITGAIGGRDAQL